MAFPTEVPGMVNGRGAWPVSGLGGTLQANKGTGGTKPGPYYMLAVSPSVQVGAGAGVSSADLSARAVNYGVRAIQRAISRFGGTNLLIDGVYGPATTKAVTAWQAKQPAAANTGVWGGVGQDSAKALFAPWLRLVVEDHFEVLYGIITVESTWDPGAVGYYDPNDLGLAQINGPANPSLPESARFDPDVAFSNAYTRLVLALNYFHGDLRTAIASYNLGLGGAAAWKKAGSPDLWTPVGATQRDVGAYVDKILNAYARDNGGS